MALLGDIVVRFAADLAPLTRGIREGAAAVQSFAKRMDDVGSSLQNAGTALTAGLTVPLAALGYAAFDAANDFETAMASVRKATNLTEDQTAALDRALTTLSEQSGRPGAAQLAELAALGAQLGIAEDALVSFTKTVSALDVSTDLGAEEAATALAQFSNIVRVPQQDIERLGSALIALGNNGESTEKMITELALRLAGAGRQIKLSASDILGFAAGMADVGIEAEAGGTALSKVFAEIGSASATGGKRLAEFAAVADQSVAGFQALFKANPAQAVVAFVEGLGKIGDAGGNTFAVLESLQFDDQRLRDALLRTAGAAGGLREQVERAGQAFKDNSALNQEFAVFAGTTQQQLRGLGNAFVNVARQLGVALGPTISNAIDAIRGALPRIQDLVTRFAALPEPVRTFTVALAGLAAVAGPVLVAVGALVAAAAAVGAPFVAAAAAVAVAVAAFVAWREEITAFGARMAEKLAPVLDVLGTVARVLARIGIVAAGALGAAVMAWVRDIAGVITLLGRAGRAISDFLQRWVEETRNVFTLLGAMARRLPFFDEIARAAGTLARSIGAALDAVLGFFAGLAQRGLTAGRDFINGIITGVAGAVARIPGVGPRVAAEIEELVIGAVPRTQVAATMLGIAIPEGVAKGVEEGTGAATGAVAGLSANLQSFLDGLSAGDASDAFEKLTNAVQTAATATEQLRGNDAADLALAKARGELQQRIADTLVRQTDQYGEQANRLRDMLATLERVQSIGAQLTPIAPTPIRQIDAPIRAVEIMDPAALAKNAKLLDQARKTAGRFRFELDDIATSARGLSQIADAFGGIDSNARRALDGVAGLASGIGGVQEQMAKLGKGASFGDLFKSGAGISSLIGAVGGAAGLLSGIVDLLKSGPSPITIALEKNREALDRLRSNIDQLATIGGTTDLADTLGQILERRAEFDYAPYVAAPQILAGRAEIDRVARDLGITFADLERAAASLAEPITLVDSEGRILIPALKDLQEALRLTADDALAVARDFRGLTQIADIRADLGNTEQLTGTAGLSAAWASALDIAKQLLPAQIAAQIEAFNINTSEGQAAARAFLANLYEQALGGTLDRTILAKFGSIPEFGDFLQTLEEPFDRFGKGLDDMTAKMGEFNVPPGFKAAQSYIEYLAAAPIGPAVNPATYTPPPPAPAPAPVTQTTTVNDNRTYPITVQATPGMTQGDARELARAIHSELRELDRQEARSIDGAAAASRYSR